jgi:hypothetical protein
MKKTLEKNGLQVYSFWSNVIPLHRTPNLNVNVNVHVGPFIFG